MERKIVYLPLEHLEERYTPMFNSEIKKYSDHYIYPERFDLSDKIETGQFLDVNKTMVFKALQLEIVARMFLNNEIKNGFIFIVADIFFPGIESIKYMAELQGISVKICSFNHAGRADENDFVQGLGSWADHCEKGYHEVCDLIFFGSEFHRDKVVKYFGIPIEKTLVTGMVWSHEYVEQVYNRGNDSKIERVVWPHRVSKEKGIDDLISYAKRFKQIDFLITSCGNIPHVLDSPSNIKFESNLTKQEYYQILSTSKYYLSTAYQETFGYTLQEAIYYGCLIAVPNRASYPEMVPEMCLFDDIGSVQFHEVGKLYEGSYDNNVKDIIKAALR